MEDIQFTPSFFFFSLILFFSKLNRLSLKGHVVFHQVNGGKEPQSQDVSSMSLAEH